MGALSDWFNKGKNVRVLDEDKASFRKLLDDDKKQITRTNKAFKNNSKGLKGFRPLKAFSPEMIRTGPTAAVRQAVRRVGLPGAVGVTAFDLTGKAIDKFGLRKNLEKVGSKIYNKVNGLNKVSEEMNQNDKFYNAFVNAETGHLKGDDKFRRTEANLAPGGSSAYGPAQITGSLVRNMLNQGVIPDDLKDYSNRFLDQSKLFLKYGNEKELEGYDPKYDYGGSGHLTTEQDQADYNRLAKVLIAHHFRNAKNKVANPEPKPMGFSQTAGRREDPVNELIGAWRFGPDSKKGKGDDRRYYREFMKSYNN